MTTVVLKRIGSNLFGPDNMCISSSAESDCPPAALVEGIACKCWWVFPCSLTRRFSHLVSARRSLLVIGRQLSGIANFTASILAATGKPNGNPSQRGTIMSRERIVEVVLTMLGAVLLLIAAADKHPYGFYMVLRLVITVGAVYWAWRVYKAGRELGHGCLSRLRFF